MLSFGFLMKIVVVTHQCFQLWQSRAYLHRDKVFSAAHAALGEQEELGGERTGTVDPGWPKGGPILCGVMLSNKSWGKVVFISTHKFLHFYHSDSPSDPTWGE